MFLGRLSVVNFPRLSTSTGSVERVTKFNPLTPTVAIMYSYCPDVDDGLIRSGIKCFIAVPIWEQ